MTNREFFQAIVEIEGIAPELKEFAEQGIVKLDNRNAKRSSKPSKTAIANAPIKLAILEFVGENGQQVASVIAENLAITTQKASALCKQLVDEGKLVADEVKIKGKGKVKAYTVAEQVGE